MQLILTRSPNQTPVPLKPCTGAAKQYWYHVLFNITCYLTSIIIH